MRVDKVRESNLMQYSNYIESLWTSSDIEPSSRFILGRINRFLDVGLVPFFGIISSYFGNIFAYTYIVCRVLWVIWMVNLLTKNNPSWSGTHPRRTNCNGRTYVLQTGGWMDGRMVVLWRTDNVNCDGCFSPKRGNKKHNCWLREYMQCTYVCS